MLRVRAGVFAHERQILPGTVGLERPPARFAAQLPRENQPATVERVLVPSFAQGGANAAVVIEKA
jgi:3-oxoacyl-(acyl-carrier-protein) synthase